VPAVAKQRCVQRCGPGCPLASAGRGVRCGMAASSGSRPGRSSRAVRGSV